MRKAKKSPAQGGVELRVLTQGSIPYAPEKERADMESAPTILWKKSLFFGGSKPPHYVMKLLSPLRMQR